MATQELTLAAAVTTPQARKPLPYSIKSSTGAVAGGGVVGRGVNVKSGDAFIVHEDGRMQQALSFQAFAAAVYHGVVGRSEIEGLWQAAEAAKVKPINK